MIFFNTETVSPWLPDNLRVSPPMTPDILHCTSLNWTTLHYTALHYPSLNCTSLQSTSLNYPSLHCTALPFTSLHYTSLHFTEIYCSAVQCTVVHWRTLQCTVQHWNLVHFTLVYNTDLFSTGMCCTAQEGRVTCCSTSKLTGSPACWDHLQQLGDVEQYRKVGDIQHPDLFNRQSLDKYSHSWALSGHMRDRHSLRANILWLTDTSAFLFKHFPCSWEKYT